MTLSTRLFLIRHAETDKNSFKLKKKTNRPEPEVDNDNDNDDLQTDLSCSLFFEKNCKLNRTGKIQSAILADYFDSIDHNVCAIYSSPLIRAFETADVILRKISENYDVDFYAEDRLFFGRTSRTIQSRNYRENEDKLIEDVKQLLNEILNLYNGDDVILITHNHIFGIIYKLFVDPENTDKSKYKVDNCAMSCLKFTNDQVEVLYWGKKVKMSFSLV